MSRDGGFTHNFRRFLRIIFGKSCVNRKLFIKTFIANRKGAHATHDFLQACL